MTQPTIGQSFMGPALSALQTFSTAFGFSVLESVDYTSLDQHMNRDRQRGTSSAVLSWSQTNIEYHGELVRLLLGGR